MSFNCEKCGACCRAVKCEKLENNLCTIYEERPNICRVGEMYKIRKLSISFEQYCEVSKLCCNQIREVECLE